MNKIYSLVWNCARQQVEVASELARSHGGAASNDGAGHPRPRGRLTALALGVCMTLGVAAPLWAQVTVQPGDTVTYTNSDGNLVISQAGSGTSYDLQLNLAPSLSVDDIQVSNLLQVGTVKIAAGGIDAGGQKIINVADGSIAVGSQDAVNGGQLNTTNQTVAANTSDIATLQDDALLWNGTAYDATHGGAAQKIVNVADGSVTAGSKEAVNGGQLNTTNQSVAANTSGIGTINTTLGKGFGVSANGAAPHNFHLGDTVNVAQGTNIVVAQDAAGGLTIATSMTPTFTTVTTTGNLTVGGNQTVAGTLGVTGLLSAKGGLSVASGKTVNMGGNKVTNVGPGAVNVTSTDAVNGSQLDAVQTAANGKLDNLGTDAASIFGGGAVYDPATGKISSPSYTITTGQGTTSVNNVGDAIALMNGIDPSGGGTVSATGIKYFHANSTAADSQANGTDSLAIGPAASVDATADSGIALGNGAAVNQNSTNTIAIGNGAHSAPVENPVGSGNFTQVTNAVALGTQAVVSGSDALALGHFASAGTGGVGMGANASAGGGNAVGIGAGASGAGNHATAVGNAAQASGASSVALGDGAQAVTDGTVSIGQGAGQGDGSNIAGTYRDLVNIGHGAGQNVNGRENIAIGLDAGSGVTGDQNVALGTAAGSNITGGGRNNVALGFEANQNAGAINNAVAIGATSRAFSDGVAVGFAATSTDTGVAIGREATTNGAGGVALGYNTHADGNFVALGQNASAIASDVSGVGYITGTAFSGGAVSVGNATLTTPQYRRIVNVADGAQPHDAINVEQLRGAQQSVANMVGGGMIVNPDGSYSSFEAIGSDGNPVVDNNGQPVKFQSVSQALGDLASGNLIIGSGSGNIVTYNGAGQINNVAAGTLATDAVNVQQLSDAVDQSKTHYYSVNSSPASQTVNYDNTGATGTNASAMGPAAQASGNESLAVGMNTVTKSTATNATAIGSHVTADGVSSTALGTDNTYAWDDRTVAIGSNANARDENSIVIGTDAQSNRTSSPTGDVMNSIVIGTSAISSAEEGIAVGLQATASGTRAMAQGHMAVASGTDAQASGSNAEASGVNASAQGTGATASAGDAFAMGTGANAGAASSYALGNAAGTAGTNSYAIGNGAQTGGNANDSQAIGTNARTNSSNDIAIGDGAVAGDSANPTGSSDHIAMGTGTHVTGDHAVAIGAGNTVAQANTFVLGSGVTTTQANSVVLGNASTDRAATTETGNTFHGIQYSYAGAGAPAQGVVSMGSAGFERQVINVAAGKISADSTDAVNGSQLYATDVALGNVANSAVGILGGNAALGPDGTLTMSNIAGTGKGTVNDAIVAARTTLIAGTNVTSVNQAQTNGAYSYKVDADGASVSAASGAVTVAKGAKNASNVTNYAVDLSAATKASLVKADTAVQSFVTQANGAAAQTVNQANPQANFKSGKNIQVTGDATGITVATADDVSFNSVAVGPIAIGTTGIGMGDTKITGLAAGDVTSTSTDAVNGSQLYATNQNVATNTTDIGNLTTTVNKGFYVSANGGPTKHNFQLGDTVDVAHGDNIVVSQSATTGGLTVGLNPVLTGLTSIAFAGGGPVISSSGIDMGSTKITHLAPGSDPTDAVSVSQLDAVVAGAATHDFSVNSTDPATDTNYDNGGATGSNALAAGVSAAATGDYATAVGNGAQASGAHSTALGFAAQAGFNSVAVGNSAVAAGDFGVAVGRAASAGYQSAAMGYNAAANGSKRVALGNGATANNDNDVALGAGSSTGAPSTGPYSVNGGTIAATGDTNGVVSVGAAGAERQIQNVAAGTISAASTDAVNGSQLFAVGDAVNNLGDSVASGLGGTSSYDPVTGKVTTGLDVGGSTYTNVNDAIKAVNTTASAGWNLSANGGTPVTIQPGATVNVAQGSNIVVTQAGNALTIATTDTPVFTSVTAGNSTLDTSGLTVDDGTDSASYGAAGMTIANGPSVTTAGIDAGNLKITSVADGAVTGTSTDAVNGSQLYAVQQVANAGWYLSANGDPGVNIKPGATVDVAQGTNIVVTQDANTGALTIATTDTPVFTSVTAGNSTLDTSGLTVDDGTDSASYGAAGMTIANGPSVTTAGIDAGNLKVTSVADGDVTATSTDAVNGSQLYAVQQTANAGWNVTTAAAGSGVAVGTSVASVAPGQTLTLTAGDNLVATQKGTDVAIGLNPVLTGLTSVTTGNTTLDTNGVTITGGANGTVSLTGGGLDNGGNQIHGVADGTAATDAVNLGQLQQVSGVANAGWNLSANGGTPMNIKPGATVDVAQGTNIVVTQAADGSLTIATSMTPVFTSVTAGNSTLESGGLTVNDGTHNTSYGADGMRVTNGPSVTSTGIDAGNRKITNVAAGTAPGDAANIGQLNAATGGLQTQIDNINRGGSGMFQSSADSTGSPSPTGTNSAAGGANAAASGSDSVAVGNDSTASGDQSTAVGTSASATGASSTALGDGASATGDNSVALGAGSVASDDDTVSVGSAGNERQITNVAAGTAPTDAVNVSQLQQAQAGGVQYDTNPDGTTNYNGVTLNPGGDGPTVIHNVATGVGDNDAVNVGQMNTAIAGAVSTANNYTDQRYNELKGSMTQIGNRANAGIASAIAAASLPQPYAPNQSSLGVGLGSFRGEAGIAVGLSKITESGRFILKANVNSSTRGDVGAGIGAGIVW